MSSAGGTAARRSEERQAGQASQTFTIKSKSTVTPTAALTFNGAVFKFTFRGEKGRTHSIESVNALNGVWKPITTVTGAGLDTDIVVPLPASSDKILFYRVRPN